jgi:hypothetical protein
MGFSDSLENDLKNLEAREETDAASLVRAHGRKQNDRARVIATAPWAEKLKNGKFTADLLRHATRIGFGLRTKVRIIWLGTTLRLEAREHRLELRPAPDGVHAHWLVDGVEKKKEKIDLGANAESYARKWLDTVGPAPAQRLAVESIEDDEEEEDAE